MATFKYEVLSSQRKKDGTWNVKIRITHNRKVRRISTPWYVTKEQMTKGYNIKDQKILSTLDDTIRTYRERFAALGISSDGMDIDSLIQAITTEERKDGIPFFPFAESFIKTKRTPGVYVSALNSFKKYVGVKNVYFHDITRTTIRGWVESLPAITSNRYVPLLKHIFESGKNEYNDEDTGRIVISNNPFSNVVLPDKEEPKKRAVSADVIRLVAMIPDENKVRSLRNLTRDMFLLSFCLMGMNAADIYDDNSKIVDGAIRYNRKKTRGSRTDKAFISVDIPDVAKCIVDKYKGKSRTFMLHMRFMDVHYFDIALGVGMHYVRQYVIDLYRALHADKRNDDMIAKELGLDPFHFYSARHSWATIARNDMRIDKWTVHEALNHVDKDTKIDDVYIKKDFKNINEANAQVMEYVFGPVLAFMDKIISYIDAWSFVVFCGRPRMAT